MPKSKFVALPGMPYPLGAICDDAGVNFSIFSEHATAATLCLFGGADGNDEIARLSMTERTEHIWHAYVPGGSTGSALWLSDGWSLRSSRGASLQLGQIAARSVCARARSQSPMARFDDGLSLDHCRHRASSGSARQRARDGQVRGGRFDVRLGRRSQAGDSVGRSRHLRSARKGDDRDASRSSAQDSWEHMPRSRHQR